MKMMNNSYLPRDNDEHKLIEPVSLREVKDKW